jgi:hypothetical protein
MAATKKKRTGLDALGLSAGVSSIDTGAKADKKAAGSRRSAAHKIEPQASPIEKSPKEKKPKDNWREKDSIRNTTVYVPEVVYEQWRLLAFTERKKLNDYLLEGLDLVFKDRGLKSIADLMGKK